MGAGFTSGGGNASKLMHPRCCPSSTMGGVSIESMVDALDEVLPPLNPSETATNAAVVLRLCCSRSLICERREELAIGVLKLINSLPLAVAGEDDTVAGEAVAEPTGLPTSRDGEAEVEAAVMETAVVW